VPEKKGRGQKRRGNGEGYIGRRKEGRWEGKHTVQTPPNGPKRKFVFGKTRAEVARKLARAIADAEGRILTEERDLTVGEYLDRAGSRTPSRARSGPPRSGGTSASSTTTRSPLSGTSSSRA
jgi:hypothetical protein